MKTTLELWAEVPENAREIALNIAREALNIESRHVLAMALAAGPRIGTPFAFAGAYLRALAENVKAPVDEQKIPNAPGWWWGRRVYTDGTAPVDFYPIEIQPALNGELDAYFGCGGGWVTNPNWKNREWNGRCK